MVLWKVSRSKSNSWMLSLKQAFIINIIFNKMTKVYYFWISINLKSIAEFQLSTSAEPFYPKSFDSDYYDQTSKTLIIIFRVLFALALLFQLVKVVAVDLYKAFKTLFQTHKLHLPLYVVYDICLVVLLIIILILSVTESIRKRYFFILSKSKI